MKYKYLLVCSAGGHLTELMESLPDDFNFSISLLLTYKTNSNAKNKILTKNIVNPHKSKIKYILCAIQSFYFFIVNRPEVVISTGAGIALPSIILSKIFRAKLIYIESAANIENPSRTGKFAYKYADVFIIQYDSLRRFYPDAILGRIL